MERTVCCRQKNEDEEGEKMEVLVRERERERQVNEGYWSVRRRLASNWRLID
jgi:hypothetical protein